MGTAQMAAVEALVALLPMEAWGVLVTHVAPAQEAPAFAAAPCEFPEADSDAAADKTVYALELSIVEAQARIWAYLKRQPGFSPALPPREPSADIIHAEIMALFYQRLAFWEKRDAVPRPTPESIRRVNDVSARLRLVKDLFPEASALASRGRSDERGKCVETASLGGAIHAE